MYITMNKEPPNNPYKYEGDSSKNHPSVLESIDLGIFILDTENEITYANSQLCSILGCQYEDLIGEGFHTLKDSGFIPARKFEELDTVVRRIANGETQKGVLNLEISEEIGQIVEFRVSKDTSENKRNSIVGLVQDITEKERRIRDAEKGQEVLANLYQLGSETDLTFEEKTERILSVGCEYLDLPYGFFTRIEDGVQEMVHTVGDHELLQPNESAPLENSYCRKTVESDGLVGMKDAGKELGNDDVAYEMFELGCYIGTKVLVGDTLFGTFCFAAPQERSLEFSETERKVVRLLGQWTGYELERQQFEERLEDLHNISQQLLSAETTTEVAEITVGIGEQLFNLSINGFWEYDDSEDMLRLVTETDEAIETIGEGPTYERGDGLIWESFDSSQILCYEDLPEESGTYNPNTPLKSEVHIPLGDHGIASFATTDEYKFDEIDMESLQLVEALVTEGIEAVKRKQELVERGEELRQRNERLKEFSDVVAHDLKNPLTGAKGYLEIDIKNENAEHLDKIDNALDQMEDLINKLLMIARGNSEATEIRTVNLQQIVEESWSHLETTNTVLEIEDELGEVEADETRLRQLFGNLFRNTVEHAGDDVTLTVGSLNDDEGFYISDDGVGLADDILKGLREPKETDDISSIRIGLMSVIDVVEESGWKLTVPDTKQGVRFEIRTTES
jgi:PAS domain S-box-containing protein